MRVNRFDSPMITVAKILGEDIAARVRPMWGLDEEGELRTAWRDTGVANFWFMMGNLMWCRFHSKHLALREYPSSVSFCFSVRSFVMGVTHRRSLEFGWYSRRGFRFRR